MTVYRIPYFIEQVPCERLVTIQATSPQLTAADLDAALARLIKGVSAAWQGRVF